MRYRLLTPSIRLRVRKKNLNPDKAAVSEIIMSKNRRTFKNKMLTICSTFEADERKKNYFDGPRLGRYVVQINQCFLRFIINVGSELHHEVRPCDCECNREPEKGYAHHKRHFSVIKNFQIEFGIHGMRLYSI